MKKIFTFILAIAFFTVMLSVVFTFNSKNKGENVISAFSNEELSSMALDYFYSHNSNLLPREEYNVGVSGDVIPKYQNQDMVVIEIRHINGSINTLDARYYINIYTAKGFDDMENEINLGNLK